MNSLQKELDLPPKLPQGRMDVAFDTSRFPFQQAIQAVLIEQGLVKTLAELHLIHQIVSEQDRQPDPVTHDSRATKIVSEAFTADTECRRIYRSFVAYLARDVLGYDCVFQRCPTFRFHYPAKILPEMRGPDGELLAYHYDPVFGDPIRQVNCWLPLTSAFGTNAMMVAEHTSSVEIFKEFCSKIEFDRSRLWKSRRLFFEQLRDHAEFRRRVIAACNPLVTNYGHIHLFDGRFLHGTAENTETVTRVSADFRLLSLADYEDMVATGGHSAVASSNDQNEGFVRGDFYDAKTAFELS